MVLCSRTSKGAFDLGGRKRSVCGHLFNAVLLHHLLLCVVPLHYLHSPWPPREHHYSEPDENQQAQGQESPPEGEGSQERNSVW